jgi:hypothetical protein
VLEAEEELEDDTLLLLIYLAAAVAVEVLITPLCFLPVI